MRIDPVKALIAYAGITTAAIGYALITAAAPAPGAAKFGQVDVGRINIREPDGTLRMVISNTAQAPGAIVRGHEYPHPGRTAAGMIFYNDEGTENGGLIFGGKTTDGNTSSGGSLTFDRYEQDQVVQLLGTEEGDQRMAGLNVFDRPEKRLDFAALGAAETAPADQREAAFLKANAGGHKRLFVGRDANKDARVALRDGMGRERLVMSVSDVGAARIDFKDAAGKVTKSVVP